MVGMSSGVSIYRMKLLLAVSLMRLDRQGLGLGSVGADTFGAVTLQLGLGSVVRMKAAVLDLQPGAIFFFLEIS